MPSTWLQQWWKRALDHRGTYVQLTNGERALLVDTSPWVAAVRPNVAHALWLDPGSLSRFETWLARHPDGILLARRLEGTPPDDAIDLLWRYGFESIGDDRIHVPRRIWETLPVTSLSPPPP